MVPFPLFSQQFVTMMFYEGHREIFITVSQNKKKFLFLLNKGLHTETFSMVLTILHCNET